MLSLGFPGGSDGKEFTCNEGDLDSVPGLGRSPGEGNSNPTPVFLSAISTTLSMASALGFPRSAVFLISKNSMDRGAWQVQSMGLQRVGHD